MEQFIPASRLIEKHNGYMCNLKRRLELIKENKDENTIEITKSIINKFNPTDFKSLSTIYEYFTGNKKLYFLDIASINDWISLYYFTEGDNLLENEYYNIVTATITQVCTNLTNLGYYVEYIGDNLFPHIYVPLHCTPMSYIDIIHECEEHVINSICKTRLMGDVFNNRVLLNKLFDVDSLLFYKTVTLSLNSYS